ncbi:hypothetical protein F5148DRAFT_431264 [Russula earlei]|uniref:Uncharacterized protein n=1 Tax=Russula earlei TaxID=71964 RepID=A0ACC0TZA2_9AGAM|nr:hypothetical protein F5148DRAFT_431264 [Russula earlei]
MGGAVVSKVPFYTVRIRNIPSSTDRSSLLESLGCPQDTVLSLEVGPYNFTKMTATVTVQGTHKVDELLKLNNTSLGGSSRVESRVLVDTRFDGFTVVAGGTNGNLDIIAIHGLNGHAFSSWAVNDVMWLRDLLPKRVPNVRVLLYGYNANYVEDPFMFRINKYARLFLQSLKALADIRSRRVIFICHSFGGLVLKRALMDIAENPFEYSALQHVGLGVVFLATPHRSSEYTSNDIASILVNIAKISSGVKGLNSRRAEQLSRSLQWDSKEVMDMARSFRFHYCRESQLQFANFCEQLPMKLSKTIDGLVVNPYSATLEVLHARKFSISNRDHVTIAKYADPNEEAFNLLVGELTRMVIFARERGILVIPRLLLLTPPSF